MGRQKNSMPQTLNTGIGEQSFQPGSLPSLTGHPQGGGHSSIPSYIVLAEQHVVERLGSSISIQGLAWFAGVSRRTLHDGFRRHRGCSPMRFVREKRMLAVHQDLLQPSTTTSVTRTALKWGFNHLGRFSAYYLRQFGELPSETLSRARNTAARPAAMAASATR